MKILLTGASGFLGKYLKQYFDGMSKVKTLGRSSDSDICGDLTLNIPEIDEYFDLVIHSAGKAHSVPRSEKDADSFFQVNYKGTQRFLNALENRPPKSFVFISSVSVYGLEAGENITEEFPLNAKDPYGESKLLAEMAVQKWCNERGVSCVILRLPLLIGASAPGNLAAMIKGIKTGYYFNVSSGKAKKSMVLVSDLPLAIESAIGISGVFNLTDGYHPSFFEISQNIAFQLGKRRVRNMPYLLAKFLAILGDIIGNKFPLNSKKLAKILSSLTFDDSKARNVLNWTPKPVLKSFKING